MSFLLEETSLQKCVSQFRADRFLICEILLHYLIGTNDFNLLLGDFTLY